MATTTSGTSDGTVEVGDRLDELLLDGLWVVDADHVAGLVVDADDDDPAGAVREGDELLDDALHVGGVALELDLRVLVSSEDVGQDQSHWLKGRTRRSRADRSVLRRTLASLPPPQDPSRSARSRRGTAASAGPANLRLRKCRFASLKKPVPEYHDPSWSPDSVSIAFGTKSGISAATFTQLEPNPSEAEADAPCRPTSTS
ncbi:MAG TPA: hypothetical protein VK501_12240 [Baekduia sp.]|nr:hypothetical protein [Baekduia sp.]HMJ34677.1 hypothetical protein [Baekduia sp.]